jgi:flagellar hook protein FlgE
MISSSAIALSGMNAAQIGLQTSAHNLANLSTDGFRRQRVSQNEASAGGVAVSLSRSAGAGHAPEADLVGLLVAKNAFLANLAVFRAGDRMMGSLLDAAG